MSLGVHPNLTIDFKTHHDWLCWMLWWGRQRSCWDLHFVLVCLPLNIVSFVLLLFLKPYWLSGRSSLRSTFRQFNRNFTVSFQLLRRERFICGCHRLVDFLSVYLDGLWVHPWVLLGIASFLHMHWNDSVCFSAIGKSTILYILAGITSAPCALPEDKRWTALNKKSINSSRGTMHFICGSLLLASSPTEDGRLSALLECSAYLYKKESGQIKKYLCSANPTDPIFLCRPCIFIVIKNKIKRFSCLTDPIFIP